MDIDSERENIVQNHLNIALLHVFLLVFKR